MVYYMKNKRKLIIAILIVCILVVIGCNKNTNKEYTASNKSNQEVVVDEENDIPYIKSESGEIDYININNSVINERYEKVNKEELQYKVVSYNNKNASQEGQITKVELAEPIANKNYSNILLGYTYASEVNPTSVTYKEAMDLINKVLPDYIVKEKEVEDTNFNKKYIFYRSEKGNFVVGLCYGYEFNENNEEELRKDIIIGIDYLKEIK